MLDLFGSWAGLRFVTELPRQRDCRLLSSWSPDSTFTFSVLRAVSGERIAEVCYFFHRSVQNGFAGIGNLARFNSRGHVLEPASQFVMLNFEIQPDPATGVLSFRQDMGLTPLATLAHETGHVLDALRIQNHHGLWTPLLKPSALSEIPSSILERAISEPGILSRIVRHAATGEALPEHVVAALLQQNGYQRRLNALRLSQEAAIDWALHGGNGPIDPAERGIDETVATVFREDFGMPVGGMSLHWPSGLLHLGWISGEYWSYQMGGRIADESLARLRNAPDENAAWKRLFFRYYGMGGKTASETLAARLRKDFSGSVF